MTIYRKVLCSERLPKEGDKCMTNVGIVYFRGKFNYWVNWWLEEIDLPSEEEISEKAMESTCHMAFWKCYEYLLNKLR